MTHVTCRLTVKNRDQLRNPTLGNRVWAAFCRASLVEVQYGRGCVAVTRAAGHATVWDGLERPYPLSAASPSFCRPRRRRRQRRTQEHQGKRIGRESVTSCYSSGSDSPHRRRNPTFAQSPWTSTCPPSTPSPKCPFPWKYGPHLSLASIGSFLVDWFVVNEV